MGVSRMVAGGHFASDVVWSAGIVWIVALTGLYLFRADKPYVPVEVSEKERKRKARWATLLIGILLPVITAGIVVATPYISQKHLLVGLADIKIAHTSVMEADVLDATVHITGDTCFRADYRVNAFGFPNSKIRGRYTAGDTGRYQVQVMGWYTEIRNNLTLGFPLSDSIHFMVKVNRGKIFCNLPESLPGGMSLFVHKGEIHLMIPGSMYSFSGDSTKLVNNAGVKFQWIGEEQRTDGRNRIDFHIGEGKVYLEKKLEAKLR